MNEQIQQILLHTQDPTTLVDGKPVPALTSLFHRVCRGDEEKFEEAARLIELFIIKALQEVTK
jgi:hypothetical protein